MSVVPSKTYDLNSVFIVLGGQRIDGFGETDVISFEMASDVFEDSASADGRVVVSKLNDARVYAEITVSEMSRGYRVLGELLDEQIATEGALPNLSFLMQDAINGDTISDRQAVFIARPGPGKARTAGERVFRILLPNAADQIRYGANNLV